MLYMNVGDNASTQPNFVTVGVTPGGSVTLTNVAGSSLNYFLNGIDGAATALTATNSATLTQPTWIQSAGVTAITLAGGIYG